MFIHLSVDEQNRVTGWGSSPNDGAIGLEVGEDHGVLMRPGHFVFVDGKLIEDLAHRLELVQQSKIVELGRQCEEAILGRFTAEIGGVTYAFSNDREAQSNFDKADSSFSRGRITEIPWTAYDQDGNVCRILLSADDFEILYTAHLDHIQSNIAKFRDFLQPLVMGTERVEEVEAITWD